RHRQEPGIRAGHRHRDEYGPVPVRTTTYAKAPRKSSGAPCRVRRQSALPALALGDERGQHVRELLLTRGGHVELAPHLGESEINLFEVLVDRGESVVHSGESGGHLPPDVELVFS